MKYLKISNKGEIDWRLISLLGGTTKRGNDSKVGRYGSGLKYVLAFLFRENLDFKVFSGTKELVATTETEQIRNDQFEIICIDGHRTSITTKMGPDFVAWHCVREIYSNALDEGEDQWEVTSNIENREGYTTWYIQMDKQIQEVITNWNKYFIHEKSPLWQNDSYKIYSGGQSLRIYKQGVLIYEDDKKPALFSYDFSHASINELREYKSSPNMEMTMALSMSNKEVATYLLENIKESYFEGDMDWNWYLSGWSAEWKEAIGNAKLIHQKAMDEIRAKGITLDDGKLIVVPKNVYKELVKWFPGVGALRAASKSSQFYENYDEKIELQVKKALAILEACEYPMHPELEFVYGFFEDKNTLAQVNLSEKRVYISQTLIQKPLFDTVSMLIEENEHFNTGYTDESRAFQQHFINLYTRQLLQGNGVEV